MSFPRQTAQSRAKIVRRRRLLALAVLAVAVWVLVAAISGIANLFSGGGSAAPNPTASASYAPATEACAPASVVVTAHVGTSAQVDQGSFAATEKPYLWYTLMNTTATPCKFEFVAASTTLTITSGPSDTIWKFSDCPDFKSGEDGVFDLAPNQPLITNPIAWDRVRSTATTGCAAAGNVAAAPGAYHLVATVSNIHSEDLQFLLN